MSYCACAQETILDTCLVPCLQQSLRTAFYDTPGFLEQDVEDMLDQCPVIMV
jgi:hypothetical protein